MPSTSSPLVCPPSPVLHALATIRSQRLWIPMRSTTGHDQQALVCIEDGVCQLELDGNRRTRNRVHDLGKQRIAAQIAEKEPAAPTFLVIGMRQGGCGSKTNRGLRDRA